MISLFPAGLPASLRRTGAVAAALGLFVGATAYGLAQDKNPVVATVNGTQIHQSDVNIAEEETGQLPPMSAEQKQDYMVQFLTDMTLLTQAAEAKKMGDTEDFKRKLDFARKKLLMETLLQSVAKDSLSDAALHKV
ncbi:MAG TPA: hypothetical protein VE968_07290, partial [Sphingomicrobium sp.]|nr:hypothetical protein [Sphingomicrobium sp.]